MEKLELICKRVNFCSSFDEDAFFEWIRKISCVMNIEGYGNELHACINREKIDERSLRELLALFYRYNVDMKQLAVFLNENNREWFFENKVSFWHSKVFPNQEELRA